MNTRSASFYDRFSFCYPLIAIILRPQKKVLYKEINSLVPGRLLEIGVGNGEDLKFYRNHQITGIDTSQGMLEMARKNTDAILLHMNGESLAFKDEDFDYIVLSHVLAVVEHPERLLREVHRVLRPNGKIFILNHFTPDNWLGHIDRGFSFFARKFHFRSVFHLQGLKNLNLFTPLKEFRFRPLLYFRLLILQKR